MQVSMDILQDRMDAEECVSDTWLQTWRTIPPQRPTILKAFLCRITRNLSINRLRERKAKRRDRDMTLSLEELEGVLSIPEDKSEGLSELISEFLRSLEREDRLLFMGRYWHGQSVRELADRMGLSANAAAVRLHRVREELRDFLTERGITV
jgi:RNA polymerase sigma-70 factor (ECF subfamily)